MPYFTAVVSSARYWPKPPSPVTATIGPVRVRRPRRPCGRDSRTRSSRGSPDISTGWPVALEVAAERVGVVADVDRDHRVGRAVCRASAANTAAAGHAPAAVVGDAAGLLRPPDRPARGDVGPLVDRLGRRRARPASAAQRDADVAEHARRSTGWNRPSADGSTSTCTIGLYAAMPVWLENDAPNTSEQVGLVHQPADATGVPLRPSTPAPSGWLSGTRPLALNVVSTGAPSRSASARTSSHGDAGAVPDDDHRPAGVAHERGGAASSAPSAGAIAQVGEPAGRGRGRPRRDGQHLHLVGQHEVGDAAAVDRVLDRECHRARRGRSRRARSSWRPRRRRRRADRSRSWNAPRPSTFDGTCPEIASTGARSTLAS